MYPKTASLSNTCQLGTQLNAQRSQLPNLSLRLLQPQDTDIASIPESRSPAADHFPRKSSKHFPSPLPAIAWWSNYHPIFKTSQARTAESFAVVGVSLTYFKANSVCILARHALCGASLASFQRASILYSKPRKPFAGGDSVTAHGTPGWF
jgi:hypothetical protein